MNIFSIAVNDQSIYYLGRIFGNVGNVLPGTGPAIMGAMFKAFNTMMLGVGAAIVVYTTIIGVLKTAQEGEFLGKWNSLWVPLRTVFGIAGLFPLPNSGYCFMQVIMMWIIMQGVGAADTVWTAAINYFEKGGAMQTPSPGTTPAALTYQAYGGMQSIFNALVCQASARKYYCAEGNNYAWCSDTGNDNYNGLPYSMGPAGACGTLDVTSSMSPAMKAAQAQAYQSVIPTLKQIADFFVATSAQYRTFIKPVMTVSPEGLITQTIGPRPNWLPGDFSLDKIDSGKSTCQPNGEGCAGRASLFWTAAVYPYTGSNFLRDAVSLYTGYLMNAAYSTKGSSHTALFDTSKMFQKAKANGWIFAGGYYYFIASLSNEKLEDLTGAVNFKQVTSCSDGSLAPGCLIAELPAPKDIDAIRSKIDTDTGISMNMTQVMKNAQDAGGGEGTYGSGVGGSDTASTGPAGKFGFIMSDLGGQIISGWMQALSVGAEGADANVQINPIIPLQAFGESLLIIIQIAFALIVAVVFFSVTIASTMSSVQGAGYGLKEAFGLILTPIMGLLLFLFVFAATLAVYIPLIPYILFTFGAIGWFIATIEAMVAAPIVALGILHPEGQHDIWGKAEPGVMIILNVFLRPSFMVFGMIAGMLLSYVVVTMINAAFLGVVRQINPVPGFIEIFLFMGIYTTLLISSLNKCFALIHVIPEKIMRWIQGGHADNYGEEQSLGTVSQESSQRAGAAKGAMESGASKSGERALAKNEQKNAADSLKASKNDDDKPAG